MPSTLRLKLRDGDYEPYVEILVDGVLLRDLLKQAVAPELARCVEYALPGAMDHDWDQSVLGGAARTVGLKDAFVLICGCGVSGCGCNTCDTIVTDTTITFTNFRIRWNDPPLDLAPIVFDRRQYEAEVADLTTRIATWKPPPPSPPKPHRVLITPPPPPPELHPENWPPT